MLELDPVFTAHYRSLGLEALTRKASPFSELPRQVLIVDVQRQRLGLLQQGQLIAEFQVSTALAGMGCEEGSFRTPPGWHRVHARIGAGAASGTVFRERVPAGELWDGSMQSEDLILTRILTLEGLEAGVNQGPGRDSLDRTIYIHGTNQEHLIGTPVSHGCVRMRNDDVVELFERVKAGDIVLIAEGLDADTDVLGLGRLHFAGVGGSGMSALAQFMAMKGSPVSGSDRSFDQGRMVTGRERLERLGILIHPQNGSGVAGDCGAVVYSTAVEDDVLDIVEARRCQVPLLHRSELLAHFVATHRTVAVTGTSGKSTTVAMIFEILSGAGCDPSVITGGELRALQEKGLWGNAWAGGSGPLVIEADESDGSLVRYRPAVGVVLNLQRDHKEETAVADMFRTFRDRVQESLVVGEAPNLAEFRAGATVFGWGPEASIRSEVLEARAEGSIFTMGGVRFELPMPGRHNIENAMAAIAACRCLGLAVEDMVAPLSGFRGVARRFQMLGERRSVQVVDDFGHNPAKIAASIRTARLRAKRVLAVFQPHGFGPLRFLRADFVDTFARELGAGDCLWMLDVFFAGGTVVRDISSQEVVEEIAAQGTQAEYAPSREWLVERLSREAREGDLILVMGARDPSLTDLGYRILEAL